ncbi:GNAT family N-acetyltransferase [Acanthopleuribacter pedis]|uniref:GNAT family N-acetyltransferase n=1 Tax=Acanthopleuribacter pedis TaxID=442870 RepID=A0A8J7Q5G2_9BACT|nr:GNAT family N-acetyltransferase [Acanthopleuribacter pedis]MBO1320767.1 GNAT family N-acetyltransferase [Acanthopleuribacter pedis]
MKPPVIQTNRLTLAPVTMEDAPSIQKHFDNWNIIKHIGSAVPWPYPDDGATYYLETILKDAETKEIYLWGIWINDGPNELVGLIEYRFTKDKDDNRGFWLAEPFWGKGLMSEAVAATQDFVFFDLKKERLVVKSAGSNIGSKRVKQKNGAVQVGTAKGSYHTGETTENIWEITRKNGIKYR